MTEQNTTSFIQFLNAMKEKEPEIQSATLEQKLMAINIGLHIVDKPQLLLPAAMSLHNFEDLSKLQKVEIEKFLKDSENYAQYLVDLRETGRLILHMALSL